MRITEMSLDNQQRINELGQSFEESMIPISAYCRSAYACRTVKTYKEMLKVIEAELTNAVGCVREIIAILDKNEVEE